MKVRLRSSHPPIGLLLNMRMSEQAAVLGAGLVLAGRYLGGIVISPLGGMIGDRFGRANVAAAATGLLVLALAALAMGWLAVGIVLVLLVKPVLQALLPAMAAGEDPHHRLQRLASLNTWRDLGAAIGPLVALTALERLGPTVLFVGAAALLGVLGVLMVSHRWKCDPVPAVLRRKQAVDSLSASAAGEDDGNRSP